MNRPIDRALCAVFCLVLSACSGGGVASINPHPLLGTTTSTAEPPSTGAVVIADNSGVLAANIQGLQQALPPTPFDPRGSAYSASTPSPIQPQSASRKSSDVAVVGDTTAQAGTSVNGNQGLLGMFSMPTVYQGVRLNSPPYGVSGPANILYGPTMHASEGCLEVSTAYDAFWSDRTLSYTSGLWLADFCLGAHAPNGNIFYTGVNKAFDTSFFSQYVRDLGDGLPHYAVEIFGDRGQSWRLFICNFSRASGGTCTQWSDWDLLYTSQPGFSSYSQGWVIEEAHFSAGPCTLLPPIGALGIAIALPTNPATWVAPSSSTNSYTQSFGDCFKGVTPTYTFQSLSSSDYSAFKVTSH